MAKLTARKVQELAAAKNKKIAVDRAVLIAAALRFRTCDFKRFLKLKAGMTPREVSDALDSAIDKWSRCMRTNHV